MFRKMFFLLLVLFFFSSVCFAQQALRFYGEEIVVTAIRLPRLKSKLPWDTDVIIRKEIEASSAKTLGDIIRSKSGLSVKSNGGLGSQVSARFRGANSSQILVLLNGNRINSPSLGSFDLNDILLGDVERIEIVKSPLSAIYGADAVGGVVNVITQRPTETAKTNVGVGYGEFSTSDFNVNVSGPHYYLSAASLYTAGSRINSDYKAEDFNVRLSNEYFDLGMKKYNANKGLPGSLDYLTPQARQTDANLFYDLTYKPPRLGLKIALSQAELKQHYINPGSFPPIDTTNNTVTTLTDIQQDFGQLLLGVEFRKDMSNGSNSGDNQIENNAVYVQKELEWEHLNIVLGAREDLSQVYGSYLSPRIGFVLEPVMQSTLKFSWGSSYKVPTINDLYWTKLTETSNWSGVTYISTTEGNPNLRAETAGSFDISLEKNFGDNTNARISYFYNDIVDLIRWSTTYVSSTEFITSPQNVSSALIQGFELGIDTQMSDRVKVFTNLTYQAAKDKSTEKYLNYASNLQGNLGVNIKGYGKIGCDLLVKYVGERYADLANTTSLAPYTVVDLAVTKQLGRFDLKLAIDNLFNQSYAESYGFTDVYPMPGRRYNISVKCGI